jgi:hypothetical protein
VRRQSNGLAVASINVTAVEGCKWSVGLSGVLAADECMGD